MDSVSSGSFERRKRFGEHEGGLRFGMVDVPEVGIFGEADGEEVVLGRHDAVQPKLQLAEHVDQMLLLRGRGLILFFEIANEGLKSFQFLGSEREDLGREAVAGGVERRALLPFLGARSGRFLRVQAIGAKLRFGRRAADGGWQIGRRFAGARRLACGACGRILFGRHE